MSKAADLTLPARLPRLSPLSFALTIAVAALMPVADRLKRRLQ